MTLTAVVLMIVAGLLTLGYHASMADYHRLAGPDRAGVEIVFAILLLLRWTCLAGILVLCVKKGAFDGRMPREGQYFLAFLAHALLGVVSLLSGLARISRTSLSDGTVSALSWVPYLLPAAEIAFVVTVLWPDALEAGSLQPVRLGLLGMVGAIGLAAGCVLIVLTLRESREKAERTAGVQREEDAKQKAKEDAENQAFRALTPESPLPQWFVFLEWNIPDARRKEAREAILKRPRLAEDLSGMIRSADAETARKAMYFVGEMAPPPAGVAEAIRARAAEIVTIAQSIDPAAADSRDQLYARAHTLSTGVTAAAHGLRRAGVDIRPELRSMAEVCHEREKAEPRDIAGPCSRIIKHFEDLDRRNIASEPPPGR